MNANGLYREVPIDAPLGQLFQRCLSKTWLNEQKVEIVGLMRGDCGGNESGTTNISAKIH
jgi:hypothetical protein